MFSSMSENNVRFVCNIDYIFVKFKRLISQLRSNIKLSLKSLVIVFKSIILIFSHAVFEVCIRILITFVEFHCVLQKDREIVLKLIS